LAGPNAASRMCSERVTSSITMASTPKPTPSRPLNWADFDG
jgi:hypothetical protein